MAESGYPDGFKTSILTIAGNQDDLGITTALICVVLGTIVAYLMVRRPSVLIRVVESVPPLHTPYVPLNSIVREFVGGSCYEY